MSYDTVGDEHEIVCPWCGGTICIQDVTTDGCLKPGYRDVCNICDRPYEIEDVQYTATVYVKKVSDA